MSQAVLGVLDINPRATFADVAETWREMSGRAPTWEEEHCLRAVYEQELGNYQRGGSTEDGPAEDNTDQPLMAEEGEHMAEASSRRLASELARDADLVESRLEGHRSDITSERGTDDEASNRLTAGQIVIVTARWLLIITGFVVTLWSPSQADLDTVRIVLLFLFALAIGNFFLHAQILRDRPLERSILYAASAVDIAVITLIVWRTGGLASSSFVYYYPALLALALVFPLSAAVYFVGGLMLAYALVGLPAAFSETQLQVLVARLISLLAVGVVGYIYQDIERRRLARAREQGALGPQPSPRLA